MRRLDVLPLAEQDLDDIWLYIAVDSPAAADRVLDRLVESMRLSLDQPMMGTARSELADELRMLGVGSHLVFYRPVENRIEIVRILHGRRDIDADLF